MVIILYIVSIFSHGIKSKISLNFNHNIFFDLQTINALLIVCKSKKMLWLKLREIFDLISCENMETIYKIIIKAYKIKIDVLKVSVKDVYA